MAAFYLCRICLTEDTNPESMQPLFDDNTYCSEILQRIEECGGVMLKPKEGFPRMICDECTRSLDISHKFRTMCQASEAALLETLATKSEIKEEPEEHLVTDSDAEADLLFNEIIEAEEIELEILTEKNEMNSISSNHSQDNISDFSISCSEFEYIAEQKEREKSLAKISKKGKIIKKSIHSTLKPLESRGRGRKKQLVKEEQIMCEICGNIYTKRHLLRSHMRVHLADKPFECEICNKKFARTSQVRRHMRVHTGKKPYVCKFCGRAFGDQSSHVKHERIHTKERPFSCNTCGKSFTYSNVLKNHILTHTGEKPFSCWPCNKHFTLKHQLDQHTATLTHQQTAG